MDHWSKYHVLFPMAHKRAVEVACGLKTRVLGYLGLQRMLESDNGREFVNEPVAKGLARKSSDSAWETTGMLNPRD